MFQRATDLDRPVKHELVTNGYRALYDDLLKNSDFTFKPTKGGQNRVANGSPNFRFFPFIQRTGRQAENVLLNTLCTLLANLAASRSAEHCC